MKSRSFERGYTMVFRGGGSLKYWLLLFILLAPLLMVLYTGSPLLEYVWLVIIYITAFTLTLLTLRFMVLIGYHRSFGITTSLFDVSLAVFIDFVTSMITHRVIVGFGILSIVLPLGAMIMALRGFGQNGGSMGRFVTYPLYTIHIVVITQLLAYLLIGSIPLIKYAILDAVFYIFSFLFIYYVIFKFQVSYGGIDILRLFSAYLYVALFEYSEPFERELIRKSVLRDVKIHNFIIRGGGERSLMVIPELHAGPIAKVGGGYLISDLVNAVRRYVDHVIYMHGVGSHELDPASRIDVRRVVRSVENYVRNALGGGVDDCVGREPAQFEDSGYRVTHVPLCGKSLVIISRLVKSSDDIPSDVYYKLREAVNIDWDNVILIDAQNYYSDDNTWDENDIKTLSRLLTRVNGLSITKLNIESAVAQVPKGSFGPFQFEIGDNGVVTWCLNINGKRILLVIFDGNNIKRELADRIIREFKPAFDIVEVLTTDNHQFTGIARFTRSRGYKIVGDSISHEAIMKHLRDSVNECLGRMSRASIDYELTVVNGVRVIGNTFNDMVKAAERGVEDWKKHLMVLVILPIITILILSVLLGIL
ncbi:DUF2070 family protein [Vulcanisaeta thermophila]|uniref:DUF2070 family protein n=1 Tax=Vulcanisaeta thermophila TaxID=867917 RepID=UPI000ACE3DA7|nr:DUF2070 family protein [Vulcanisaeta thermophila]